MAHSRLVLLCFLGGLAGVSIACGGSTSQDANDTVENGNESNGTLDEPDAEESSSALEVAREEFIEEYVEDTCAALRECCANLGYGFDDAACAEDVAPSGPLGHFDAEAASACLAKGMACTDSIAFADDPCEDVLRGDVPLGGECVSGFQCAAVESSSVICDTRSTTGGKCFSRGRAALGDSCDGTCAEFGAGAVQCTSVGEGGDAERYCFFEDGIYCGSAGTCLQLPTEGQGCDHYCAEGLDCVSDSCVAAGSEGGECSLMSSFRPCGVGLTCNDGSCVLQHEAGEPCEYGSDCVSGECLMGTCAAEMLNWRLTDLCVAP